MIVGTGATDPAGIVRIGRVATAPVIGLVPMEIVPAATAVTAPHEVRAPTVIGLAAIDPVATGPSAPGRIGRAATGRAAPASSRCQNSPSGREPSA